MTNIRKKRLVKCVYMEKHILFFICTSIFKILRK
nr:MAG TPA: hypothetical protein [Caudoviricetes sp.]DAZ73955.1 MAG TPA: hypothetical protein [Caudoviricetes sp.]